MKKKVGFYMGSFDPIHIGHIATITAVLRERILDEVLIVPAIANPAKRHEPASLIHREAMILRMIVQDLADFDGMVSVCHGRGEADPDGKYYSYRQLSEILQMKPELTETDNYIIAGTDIAPKIRKWKNSAEILAKFKVLEIVRPGYVPEKGIENGIACSSSAVREMIASGKSPIPWVPSSVWEVIKEFKLYGSGQG